jgi:hypothetical protein
MDSVENKMERLKTRLIKIHGKIQDRMEDFQDHVHTKYEKSRISKFISHLSEDRSSLEGESTDNRPTDGDNTSTDSEKLDGRNNNRTNSIPSVVVDGPEDEVNKTVCENFLQLERSNVLYPIPIKSLSTSNLNYDNDSIGDSSSESCVSCLSSNDER